MKINLKNMRNLAEKLDNNKFALYTEEDVMTMAYQLQYFFEAMEKLKLLPGTSWADAVTAYKIIDLFNNAIVDKEE